MAQTLFVYSKKVLITLAILSGALTTMTAQAQQATQPAAGAAQTPAQVLEALKASDSVNAASAVANDAANGGLPPSATTPTAPSATAPVGMPMPAPPDNPAAFDPAAQSSSAQPNYPPNGAPASQPSLGPNAYVAQPFMQPDTPNAPAPIAPIANQYKDGLKDQFAILRTSYGKITIKLYPQYAPRTVKNFVELARGQKEFVDLKTGRRLQRPFYNGLIFHRVIRGFLAQTGCPNGTGRGTPGYSISDEINRSLKHSRTGVVAMANVIDDNKHTVVPDSAGSQFFITLGAHPEFDGHFTIFGQVIDGFGTLEKIGNAKTGPTNRPAKRIVLQAVEIVEK